MDSAKNFINNEISFESSLDAYCSDTKNAPIEKKSKGGNGSLYRAFVMLICAAIFIYCVYSLIDIYRSNLESDALYSDIHGSFADILGKSYAQPSLQLPTMSSSLSSSASTPSQGGNFNTIDQGSTSIKFQQILSKLETLRTQNPDTAGYITVTGTGINYPIVKGTDNDFYLTHAFDKMLHKSGSIFYDWRNDSTPDENRNLVVYGHNMANGSMFHQLKNFIDNEPLFTESQIVIYAFDGIYTYDIFAIYYANAYDNYLRMSFISDNDFITWCEERAALSMFKTDVKFDADSHLISLSTCLNGTSDGRIAVHGILTNVER